ncbi:MAG: AAA family ATPase, partial [Trueperaceae bacterium]|nr:AAA family ATPase [Trueperaceae bacterium]
LALLRTDPLDERAVGCGLRSLAAAGRLDAAARLYAAYVRDLGAEFGVEPDAALEELHRAIVDGAGTTPVAPTVAPRPRPRSPPVPWGTTSFVGRRAELAELDERLASALAGEGGLVVVEGEAGVGKTRLVETFLAALPDGVRAFTGRCLSAT